ncbi:hypothetical protein BDV93DRAFT_604922 [Ceratobasidium sp. AG-I]|nr:hypothetical protein BDV93DRAFT_604922 [Ceratobasidium sp. AG-I]
MSETNRCYVLFHAKGCGSVFPLVVLRALNIPHELVTCDFQETTRKEGPNYTRLLEVNPLVQFPTLITPEGSVMTEMAAIVLYLQHHHAKGSHWDIESLSPPQLAAFYRWFIFIPANIYSALTVSVFPGRFVNVPLDAVVDPRTVESWVTKGALARRGEMWIIMEQEMPQGLGLGRFVLGTDHPTFLDVLLAMVSHFMLHADDRYSWFPETCPKLFGPVKATIETEVVKEVFLETGFNQYFDMSIAP